jgi:hypothetical protein
MDIIDDTRKYITVTIDDNTKWLDNSTVATLLTLGLVVYAAMFVGKVYPPGVEFFKNPLVKIVAFLVILYLSSRNIGLALVVMIAIFSIMIKASNCPCAQSNTEAFTSLNTDDYEYPPMREGCVCVCRDNNCRCRCLSEYQMDEEQVDDFQLPGLSKEQLKEGNGPQEVPASVNGEEDEDVDVGVGADADSEQEMDLGEDLANVPQSIVAAPSELAPSCPRATNPRRSPPRGRFEEMDQGYIDSSTGSQYASINF